MVGLVTAPRAEKPIELFRRAREIEDKTAAELERLGVELPKVLAKLDRATRLEAALEAVRPREDDRSERAEALRQVEVWILQTRDLRWQAVLRYPRDAHRWARRFGGWAKQGYDKDVLSYVWLGMYDAARRYRPDSHLQFQTYAQWWARARVSRELGADISAYAREKLRTIRRIEALGISDETEIAERLGFTLKRLRRLRVVAQAPVELDAPYGEKGKELLVDCFAGPEDESESESDFIASAYLARAISRLPGRHRRIVQMRYPMDDAEPVSIREIASELDLSTERVRQLEREALELLGEAMNADDDPIDWDQEAEMQTRGNPHTASRRDQCVAVVLKHPEGISVKNVAELLGISPGNASAALQVAHDLKLVVRTGNPGAVLYWPPKEAQLGPQGPAPAPLLVGATEPWPPPPKGSPRPVEPTVASALHPPAPVRSWADVAEDAGLPGPQDYKPLVQRPVDPPAAPVEPPTPDPVTEAKARWEKRAEDEAAFVEKLEATSQSVGAKMLLIIEAFERIGVPHGPLEVRLAWLEGRCSR
jgi:RNA polymerase sigma factor (sigma-70 family)